MPIHCCACRYVNPQDGVAEARQELLRQAQVSCLDCVLGAAAVDAQLEHFVAQ